MDGSTNVTAVVVTYNRRSTLERCLDALCTQTIPPGSIIVIDNASTDGTSDLFTANGRWQAYAIDYVRLDSNKGGAGGFKEGLKRASQTGSDWYWIMDDDVVPQQDALAGLLDAAEYLSSHHISPSFLASHVRGDKGEVMNVPNVSDHLSTNGYPDWLEHLPAGLVRISSATFVSLLISAKAVEQVGLPISDYFLWGDDIEYTKRLTSYTGPAFACGTSVVTHLRKNAQPIDIVCENDAGRIANHRKQIRNDLINAGYYGGIGHAVRRVGYHAKTGAKILLKHDAHKLAKVKAIGAGVLDYLTHRYDLEDLGKLNRRSMHRN